MNYRKDPLKKAPKKDREKKVLLGLVELYLKTGLPIGSNTLQEHGFESISTATIRNYFAKLEKEGFLTQQHTSGGRIPTDQAIKLYALNHLDYSDIDSRDDLFFDSTLNKETKQIGIYLQEAAQALAHTTGYASFISAPILDHDFISNVKLVSIDSKRILCVLLTDYAMVYSEVIFILEKLSSISLKRVESFFKYRLAGLEFEGLSETELAFAMRLYNEVIMRHLSHKIHSHSPKFYKGGLAKLLHYKEFHSPAALASCLSLFETPSELSTFTKASIQEGELKFYLGQELDKHLGCESNAAIITMPYRIQGNIVGCIALLAPLRCDYRKTFALLRRFENYLSKHLTQAVQKFKIAWRSAPSEAANASNLYDVSNTLMIEDKS